MRVEFVEWEIFTERITQLLSDEEYRNLQSFLLKQPTAGSVIPGGGGLRKLRWRTAERGKRGGIRVIYYVRSAERLYMVYAYDKREQSNLTNEQLKALRTYVMEGLL